MPTARERQAQDQRPGEERQQLDARAREVAADREGTARAGSHRDSRPRRPAGGDRPRSCSGQLMCAGPTNRPLGMPTLREPIEAQPAQHRALLYGDAIEFVEAVVPFVRDGLRAGEAILVALAQEKLEWFREELGDAADAVETADAAVMYARNGPMLNSLLQRFAGYGTPGERQIRVVAEQPLAARTPVETRAYLRYESAANVAYRPFAATVLCPYDTSTLSDTVLKHALQTHPHVLDGATARAGEAFIDPREFI